MILTKSEIVNQAENAVKEVQDKAFSIPWEAILYRLASALIILFIGWQLIRLARKLLKRSLDKTPLTQGMKYVADIALLILLSIILFIVIAELLGIPIASFIAILGSLGVAIGLAIQGSLSNLAAGILLIFLRPFEVKDEIQLDNDLGKRMKVKQIKLFVTHFEDLNGFEVIVPNSKIIQSSIINITKNPIVAITVKIGVSYAADIQKVREIVFDVFNHEERILKDREYTVVISDFADSSVNLLIKAWAQSKEQMSLMAKMREEIKLAFDKNQVEIPFPQLDVYMKSK